MTRNTQLISIGLTLTLLSGTLTGCSGPATATKAVEPPQGKAADEKAPEAPVLAGNVV